MIQYIEVELVRGRSYFFEYPDGIEWSENSVIIAAHGEVRAFAPSEWESVKVVYRREQP